MKYRVLKFWKKLGKNCRVFLTSAMEGSLHPTTKILLITLPTRKNFCCQQTLFLKFLSLLLLHNNFIMPPVLSKTTSRSKK